MFPIVRVNSETAVALEQLGTKGKFWYTAEDGRRMLFKAEERGTGEDWAEKVVCELAALLGLPHVHYEMAFDIATGKPGVVSASFLGPEESLSHGNTLLLAFNPEYPTDHRRFKVAEHTIAAVANVLDVIEPPMPAWTGDAPEAVGTAIEFFCGYLMLDAWVANQDRHHENWGAVWSRGELCLAPSYDHGASLARNLDDEEREARLTSRDARRRVAHFVTRARTALYAEPTAERSLLTIDAFDAMCRWAPDAREAWTDRLRRIEDSEAARVLAKVPHDRLSATGREFTLQLLVENRKRILAPRGRQA